MTALSDVRSSTAAALSSLSSGAPAKTGASLTEDAKIDKSAKDFEAILLSNWLQQAEESFAKVPGDDDEEDGTSSQFTQMAMQSLGTSFAGTGGIGIAKMIATQLHKTQESPGDTTKTESRETTTFPVRANFFPPALNSTKEWPIR